MIPSSVLEQLEFDKVLEYIAKYAATEGGRQRILNLHPYDSIEIIEENGKAVKEAKDILIEKDYPPISYLPNLKDILYKSRIENGMLRSEEIKSVLALAEISSVTAKFFKSLELNVPYLKQYAERLFYDKAFEKQIKRIFNESGEISDAASPKLREIREEILLKSEHLRNVVNRILKRLSDTFLVREEYTTQRDGRIVLPIKVEHKRKVKGFIHSESATGQTVYIEPEETLELNNEILSLKFAERREIERILRKITALIGERSAELLDSFEIISYLDEQFAKAKYALEIIGAFPTINNNAKEKIIEGRHPVLLKKLGREKTVPLDMEIAEDKVIVITGPNAGGKTVVLKNFGLLHLMVYAGIPIPAHPDTNIHFYEEILLDIGDRQSIEDDLSTFSSHLSNIKEILERANDKTLILLDEIGTGTDPSEGAALAASTLIALRNKGAVVLATTHHGDLKILANREKGLQNASMEFDADTISPTYRFKQGMPGSSYAFEVAERIGLPKEIIEKAKDFLETDRRKLEEFLIDVEKKSARLSKKLHELELENARLRGLSRLYKEKIEKLEKSKNKIIEETRLKAESYLAEMNREFENTIKEIRESNARKEKIKEGKDKIKQFREAEVFKKAEPKAKEEGLSVEELRVGDFVALKNSGTVGEVISIDHSKKRAIIIAGSLKLQVKISDLVKAEKPKEKKTQSADVLGKIVSGVKSSRLDIRGKKPEEVEFEVIKFIDDAYAVGVDKIEILHGKGTGALKKTVWEILEKHEAVRNFHFAKIEYGGEGITVVELK